MKQVFVMLFSALAIESAHTQSISKTDSVCGIFGIACGYSATPEESTMKMIRLVNQNDKAQLLNWMNSNNPQNKIHGFVGLYFMKRNGYSLSKDEKGQVDAAKRSNPVIDYCSGCISGTRDN